MTLTEMTYEISTKSLQKKMYIVFISQLTFMTFKKNKNKSFIVMDKFISVSIFFHDDYALVRRA